VSSLIDGRRHRRRHGDRRTGQPTLIGRAGNTIRVLPMVMDRIGGEWRFVDGGAVELRPVGGAEVVDLGSVRPRGSRRVCGDAGVIHGDVGVVAGR
jgi:hypothetical protein